MNLPTQRAVSTSARTFTFGAGTFRLWLQTLDKLSWEQGQRHFSRWSALVRARSLGLSADEITQELLSRCGVAGDSHRDCKVRADIAKFYNTEPHPQERSPAPVALFDPELRNSITARSCFDLADLQAASPVSSSFSTEEIIDALFPPWALLCVAYSEFGFVTKLREELRGGLRNKQFICPQPMTAEKGYNAAGALSYHTLDNCGPWTYLVLEWDRSSATISEQAQMLIHLRNRFGQLVLVVHSGGESLHGWFHVEHWPNEQRDALATYALRLGACSGTIKNRSQFVRMPGGLRHWPGTGEQARQNVHYFDVPEVLNEHIMFSRT